MGAGTGAAGAERGEQQFIKVSPAEQEQLPAPPSQIQESLERAWSFPKPFPKPCPAGDPRATGHNRAELPAPEAELRAWSEP